MLTLQGLKPKIKKKARKRVGRGGQKGGTYAGRGLKGQKARSGGRIRPGFEGGRMPFIRQMPKARGFRSVHPKSQVVGLADVARCFENGAVVTPAALAQKGLVRDARLPAKLLGAVKISKKFTFKQINLSAAARAAVTAAGGTIEDVQ